MQTQTSETPGTGLAGNRINQALEPVERKSDTLEPRALSAPRGAINVAAGERAASVIGGAGLLAYSLAHPLRRLPAALAGVALLHRGVTGHCYGYGTLGINTATNDGPDGEQRTVDIVRSITIGRDPAALYRLWQQPGTLDQVIQPIAELEKNGETTTWRIHGPLDRSFEFRTRVAFEKEPEVIRWVPEEGQEHKLHGSLHLKPAPSDQGTEVTLRLAFVPPGGQLGKALLKLLGPAPKLVIDKGLRRFKALAETGEVPTLEHNPAARDSGQD
jgi:uncharacterized membrane protein